MKTMKINVCGKKYPVCLNARVLVAGEERFGSLEKFDAAAFSPDIAFADFIWLLATMLDAGYKVAKREGEEPEKPGPVFCNHFSGGYDGFLDVSAG